MLSQQFADRRIFERFPLRFSLKYATSQPERDGSAQSYDFSAEGIGVLANKELPRHTPLDLWLNIPDHGEPLRTKGEVVWMKKVDDNNYRAGIKLESAQLMGMSRALRLIGRNAAFTPESAASLF